DAGEAAKAARHVPNYGVVSVEEREEEIETARSSARSALELDPNLTEAHTAQGAVLRDLDLDLVAAEAEYRRAFELAPQNASAVNGLALLLSSLGRLDEAVALTQRAIAIDPLRVSLHTNLALYLIAPGRYDDP